MEGDSPKMDKEVFLELNRLIALSLANVPQERITPEMVAKAEARAQK